MPQQTVTTNGYFRPGLFRFLKDLKTHNERAWFQANKQRYEAVSYTHLTLPTILLV